MKGRKQSKIKLTFILFLLIIPLILPAPVNLAYQNEDSLSISFYPQFNEPPMKPINPNPPNESVDMVVPVTLSVDVYDDTGDFVDVYFYNASNDALIGVDYNVPADWSTASVVWNEPIKGRICYWYAVAQDHMYYNRSDTWLFATRPNQPSVINNNEYPANKSTNIELNVTCGIEISDIDEDAMTVYWYENTTGSWILRQTNSSVPNGTYYWQYQHATNYSTKYYWMVIVNDTMQNTSAVFYFTTLDNQPLTMTNPNPANQSINVSKTTPYWYINIQDPENDLIDWSIETSPNVGNSSATADVSGQKACPLSGLEYITNYTVYVNATDSVNRTWVNETFWFETAEQGAPTISNEYPVHKNTGTEITPTCHVDVYDIEGDNLTIYWFENTTGNWTLRRTESNITANSTVYWSFTQASSYLTIYYWRVIVNDSHVNTSATYSFTTRSAPETPGGGGGTSGGGYTPLPNQHPIAVITGPSSAYENENFMLYAYYSYDPDGLITGYRWDFNNDGTYDTDWIKDLLIEHNYSKAGNYTIRLQVKDNNGAIATTSHNITIVELVPPLQLPIPKIDAPDYEYTNKNITFNTNESYDPDGEIINYTWDFGDGNISYLKNPTHIYAKPGNYTVVLTVTDNNNLTNVTTTKIIIIEKEEIEKEPEVKDLPLTILLTIIMAIIVSAITSLILLRKFRKNITVIAKDEKPKIEPKQNKKQDRSKTKNEKETKIIIKRVGLGEEADEYVDINTMVDNIINNKK